MRISRFFNKNKKLVSVVSLSGLISAGSRGQLNDYTIAPCLEKAFTKGDPDAVAIVINSPGGSPVQSSLIGARIRRLAKENNVPVYAFVEDVAASGGYWLASSADEIFVDHSSVVGSIGVISAGFGASELISRYGIERRIYTAGKSKSTLDPFSKEKPLEVKKLQQKLDQIHQVFLSQIQTSRGDKLSDDPELFSGDYWIGAKAIELGLADSIGHLVPVMQERFGKKVKFRNYGPKKKWFQKLSAAFFYNVTEALEEKAALARFGL